MHTSEKTIDMKGINWHATGQMRGKNLLARITDKQHSSQSRRVPTPEFERSGTRVARWCGPVERATFAGHFSPLSHYDRNKAKVKLHPFVVELAQNESSNPLGSLGNKQQSFAHP